jgi:hypothetical protein
VQTTSLGSNQSGSSQSSLLVKELKLDETTNFGGAEEYSSSSPSSFSDRVRFSCEFALCTTGVVATVCTGSFVGNIDCLTLYPSETAKRELVCVVAGWRGIHLFFYEQLANVFKREKSEFGNVHFHSDLDELRLDEFWDRRAGNVIG